MRRSNSYSAKHGYVSLSSTYKLGTIDQAVETPWPPQIVFNLAIGMLRVTGFGSLLLAVLELAMKVSIAATCLVTF